MVDHSEPVVLTNILLAINPIEVTQINDQNHLDKLDCLSQKAPHVFHVVSTLE